MRNDPLLSALHRRATPVGYRSGMPAIQGKKKQSSGIPKAMTLAILALVVGGGAYFVIQRSSQINEYNKIIDETVNQQKYQEAIPRLEAFIAKAQGDLRNQAKTDLAKCYLAIGDDPGLSMKQSAEIFRKAHDLDPSALDEQQKKILELGSKDPGPQE
jgi:hypothetical protein